MALPNKTKIPVGTVLAGKYRVTREIGRGGMAAVYEAANVDIGKRVAIKVLAQELTTSAVVVERFLREARAAAAIRSPYICDIYDSGRLDDGRPFLVLELLEGESLYERMTKIRWLDIEMTISIITQVCRGLTKAHAANIVHRDLKPENIFLTKDEEGKLLSKILDFGLAMLLYTTMENDGPQARLTREGAVFGTPAYMSPEQVRGQGAVDQRADLWALGCIVYECFTGRTVWSTEQGVAMTFAQIANAALPRPSIYRPDLPEAFTAWFDKALDRDITKRFQSAKEFAQSFAAVFDKENLEISTILSTPALLKDMPRDVLENPFPCPARPLRALRERRPLGRVAADRDRRHHRASPSPHLRPQLGERLRRPDRPSERHRRRRRPRLRCPRRGVDRPRLASPLQARLRHARPARHRHRQARASPQRLPRARRDGPRRRGRRGRALGYLVWTQLIEAPAAGPHRHDAPHTPASDTPPPPASAEPSANPSAHPVSEAPAPPWLSTVREGQQAVAAGNLKGAYKLFKDAHDKQGGHGLPKMLSEHVSVAMADKGPCHLTGLARPRAYDVGFPASYKPAPVGRPAIALGPHGAVVTWTDAHEGREHAYAVALDDVLRDGGVPLDVTPEAVSVVHPELIRAGDKLLLLYADAKGTEAGVHARYLDADGHFSGGVVQVSPPKERGYWPAIAAAPDGSFYVAWSDERDGDSEDLFFRHLLPTLEPMAEPVRATDFVPAGPSKPRVRLPAMAITGDAVQLAFRLEREPQRLVEHLRLPLMDAAKGLPPAKKGERKDRNIGEMFLVNTDKSKADAPSLACGGGSCYLAWHVEQNGGGWVARIDPAVAKAPVRWQVTRTGGHPAVAVSPTGEAQVVWFENKQVFTAPLTRDGVGPPSKIARVSADVPQPSLAPGTKPGEWYLAWTDYEVGHLEAYAARVQCK